jgi:hypothetical protein
LNRFHFNLRGSLIAVAAFAVLAGAATLPGSASIKQNMANKAATDAGNSFVTKIGGETCAQFAATMAQMKSGSGGNSASSKLKGNAGARTTFVNIVAAPLLNKMIDCNMLPSGG